MVELMIVCKSMPPSLHIQTMACNIGQYYKYSKKIIRKGWRNNEQNGKKRKKRRIDRIMKRISRNTGRDDMLFGDTPVFPFPVCLIYPEHGCTTASGYP